MKGTTGTQASFLELFGGDHAKVRELDRARRRATMGFARVDSRSPARPTRASSTRRCSACVAGIAASAAKFAATSACCRRSARSRSRSRAEQIGSSAMAYKRNPMRAERIASLARFVHLARAEREPDARRAVARAHARRQRQPAPRHPRGVPRHRRDPGPDGQHRGADSRCIRRASARRVADELPFMATEALPHARRARRRRPPGGARGASGGTASPRRARMKDGGARERPARAAGRRPGVRRPGRATCAAALDAARFVGRAPRAGRRVPRARSSTRCCARRARAAADADGGARMTVARSSNRPSPAALRRGKVREVYEVDAERLLLVASDRVSAFDVVMREPVPHKGAVLTQITAFWFRQLERRRARITCITADADEIVAAVPALAGHRDRAGGPRDAVPAHRRRSRSSAWCAATSPARRGRSTRRTGTLAGEPLPPGLRESDRLEPAALHARPPRPKTGHDENITFARDGARRSAPTWPRELERLSRLRLRTRAATIAAARGIIIADTKFEFGRDAGRTIRPDRRGADARQLALLARRPLRSPGSAQPSFDKQPLRDYLDGERARRALERRRAAAAAAGRGRRGDERALPRRVPAHHRRAARDRRSSRELRPRRASPFIVDRRGARRGACCGSRCSRRSWPLWLLAFVLDAGRALGRVLLPRSRAHGRARRRARHRAGRRPGRDDHRGRRARLPRTARAIADLDLHERLQRAREPVSGERHGARTVHYNPGKFLNAAAEKASLENEQTSVGHRDAAAAACSCARSPGSSPGASSPYSKVGDDGRGRASAWA